MTIKKYVANETGFSGHRWPQHRSEVSEFVALMRLYDARSYLEIGCLNGDTLHHIGTRMPRGSRVVGVDLPRTHEVYADAPDCLMRAASDLCRLGQDARVIVGDSHDQAVVKRVRALGPFDALLIDGDHSTAGVLADWENYGPMARLVGIHDAHKLRRVREVYEKLAARHESRLILLNEEIGIGIGVIFCEPLTPPQPAA